MLTTCLARRIPVRIIARLSSPLKYPLDILRGPASNLGLFFVLPTPLAARNQAQGAILGGLGYGVQGKPATGESGELQLPHETPSPI